MRAESCRDAVIRDAGVVWAEERSLRWRARNGSANRFRRRHRISPRAIVHDIIAELCPSRIPMLNLRQLPHAKSVYREGKAEGRGGKAEGRSSTSAESVVTILAARGVSVNAGAALRFWFAPTRPRSTAGCVGRLGTDRWPTCSTRTRSLRLAVPGPGWASRRLNFFDHAWLMSRH